LDLCLIFSVVSFAALFGTPFAHSVHFALVLLKSVQRIENKGTQSTGKRLAPAFSVKALFAIDVVHLHMLKPGLPR